MVRLAVAGIERSFFLTACLEIPNAAAISAAVSAGKSVLDWWAAWAAANLKLAFHAPVGRGETGV
jgi:hypothetical protein